MDSEKKVNDANMGRSNQLRTQKSVIDGGGNVNRIEKLLSRQILGQSVVLLRDNTLVKEFSPVVAHSDGLHLWSAWCCPVSWVVSSPWANNTLAKDLTTQNL